MYSSTLIGVRDSYLLEELWSILPENVWAPFLTFFGGILHPLPPRNQRVKIAMILRYKYTVKKAKENLKLRVDRLQAMTGIIYEPLFKHYSLINCIIYVLLIFSCDRCVQSEEIGAYSFSYQDQYVYSAFIH